MTPSEIASAVNSAIELQLKIAALEAELDLHKKSLLAQFITDSVENPFLKQKTTGGGYTIHYRGDLGMARITKPGPALRSSFKADDKALTHFPPDSLPAFFNEVLSYEPYQNFRDDVAKQFEPDVASKILKACTTKPKTQIHFEIKPPAETPVANPLSEK
jgi:hypothetical protein